MTPATARHVAGRGSLGEAEGDAVGLALGDADGASVGEAEGDAVGLALGDVVGVVAMSCNVSAVYSPVELCQQP